MVDKSGLYLPIYIDMDAWEQQLLTLKEDTAKTLKQIADSSKNLDFKFKMEITGAEAANDYVRAATLNIDKLNDKVVLYQRSVEVVNKALQEERAELEKTGKTESARSKALEAALARDTMNLNKFTAMLNKASRMSYTLTNNLTNFDSKMIDKLSTRDMSTAILKGSDVQKAAIEVQRLTDQMRLYSDALKEVSSAYVQEVSANGAATKNAELLRSTMVDLTIKVNEYKKSLAEVSNLQARFTQAASARIDKQYALDASKAGVSGDEYAKREANIKRLRSQIALYQDDLQKANKALADEVKQNGAATLAAKNWQSYIESSTTTLNKYITELDNVRTSLDSIVAAEEKQINRKAALDASNKAVAGDEYGKREAELKRITDLMALYKRQLYTLNKGLADEVKAHGEGTRAANAYKEKIDETKIKINSLTLEQQKLTNSIKTFANDALQGVFVRIGRFSVSVRQLSNHFESVGKAVGQVQGKIGGLIDRAGNFVSAHSADLAKWAAAYGPVAAAIGLVTVGVFKLYQVAEDAMNAMRGIAREGIEAAKSLQQFKSRFSMDDATAGKWADMAAMAGTEINTLAFAVGEVTIGLDKGTAAGKRAENAFKAYDVAVRDASGDVKNFNDFMLAVAEGYKKAAAAGEGNRFLKDIFGRQWVTVQQLIPAMERYRKILEKTGGFTDGNLDNIKAAEMAILASNQALGANKRLWADIMSETEQYYQQLNMDRYKAINDFLKDNKELIKDSLKSLREILGIVTRIGTALVEVGSWLAKNRDLFKGAPMPGFGGISITNIKSLFAAAKDQTAEKEKQVGLEDELVKLTNKRAEGEKNGALAIAAQTLEQEKLSNSLKEIYESLDKTIRQGGMSDYERELDNINERYDKLTRKIQHTYAEQGMTVDWAKIEESRAVEIEKIREKYIYEPQRKEAEKQKQEQEKLAKEAVKKYEEAAKAAQKAQEEVSLVFMSETEKRIYQINKEKDAWIKAGADEVAATRAAQKQIADAKLSEAERTLREQAALIKKTRKLQEAGDPNWEDKAKAWADKQYMKGLGLKSRDLAWAQTAGLDLIRGLGNARDRVLASFAGTGKEAATTSVTNQNTVNVNFDNTVVENESAMLTLANRVAELIVPHVEKAIGAGSGTNSYAGAGA